MAAFGERPIRKKLTTYGKPSRKKLPYTYAHYTSTSVESERVTPVASEASRDASPAASVDIFDVPSSDDERPAESRKRKLATKPTTSAKKQRLAKPQALNPKKIENKAMLSQTELRMRAVRQPSADNTSKLHSQGNVQGNVRPKSNFPTRPVREMKKKTTTTVVEEMASVTLSTPKKIPSNTEATMSTPSPASIAAHDVRQTSISPEGKRMWNGLLNDTAPAPAKKRRRKLIDTLKAQREESDDDSVDNRASLNNRAGVDNRGVVDNQDGTQMSRPVSMNSYRRDNQDRPQRSELVSIMSHRRGNRALEEGESDEANLVQAPSMRSGLKTYGGQRSFRTETSEDFESQLAAAMPLGSPNTSRSQGRVNETEDEAPGVKIRSVHELQKEGAKSHFVGGVDDLLDLVDKPQAKPSSSRRSALMELATKLLQNDYRRQFLEIGTLEQRLFVHLGQETDMIAGYLLASILFTVLSEDASSISIDQLRRQGITRLLIRLLDVQDSVSIIARDAKSKMSRQAQSLLMEYQTLLLKSDLLEERYRGSVSPRTVALRCIERMVNKTREAGNIKDVILPEMTSKLFEILKENPSAALSDLAKDENFRLALSTIEHHTRTGLTGAGSEWTSSYLPFISQIMLKMFSLEDISLQMEDYHKGCFTTVLKLVLSVTHGNEEASNAFSGSALMSAMGTAIVTIWKQMSGELQDDEKDTASELLHVVTTTLMNVMHSSQLARKSFVDLSGADNDYLAGMVEVFNDREESSSQAATTDAVSENVPLGWLTCVLGYLCQESNARKRIVSYLPGKRIKPLTMFVANFFGFLNQVATADGAEPSSHELEDLKSLGRMTDNLWDHTM